MAYGGPLGKLSQPRMHLACCIQDIAVRNLACEGCLHPLTWTCLQLRFNAAIILGWAIGTPLYWFAGADACANWAVSSPGILPVLLCFTTIAVLHLGLMQPRLPSDGFEPPSYLLQARPQILCCGTCGPT